MHFSAFDKMSKRWKMSYFHCYVDFDVIIYQVLMNKLWHCYVSKWFKKIIQEPERLVFFSL